MNTGADLFGGLLGGPQMMLALLVFLATATLAYSVMAGVRLRGEVKRRAAGINLQAEQEQRGGGRSLRQSSMNAAKQLLDYTTKHYSAGDTKDMKLLRRRLLLAGIYDPRAVGFFFLARTGLAVGLALAVFFFASTFVSASGSKLWMMVIAAGIFGYVGPSLYLDRRIKARKAEHQSGFPDFMDLLVVCADSGLSMEAALTRIGNELADSYPSLCANIHMTNLEIRAGRTLTEALDHLADRLGLEEARSFAVLIQQSTELGSSITDALRVYSDDMRHKRLSRAEEKAYALPAKLAIPMMVCIFPVIFVVILLPVIVRLTTGNY
ncbi:MAG TPA: type II secretion system F family protein [Xanthobacteraceae bacterium]|nr:type II secretion system F family protein [Xanthobacteraceae bacterium]